MHKKRPRSQKSMVVTTSQLVYTLMRQIHPQEEIPGLLQTHLAQDGNDLQSGADQPTPLFKYGRIIRKFVPSEEIRHIMLGYHCRSRVMEYAVTHQLHDKYVAEGVIVNAPDKDRKFTLEYGLEKDLYRQLMWALCKDHLEHIEELTISLVDIERYIDHVDRLTSLSKVRFTVEKMVRFSDSWFPLQEDKDQQRHKLEAEGDRLFITMVDFVRQHASIHKHVLRHAVIPDSYQLPRTSRRSTVDVQFEILFLLPPLQNPRAINNSNWLEFVARLPDTNLNYLESITLTTSIMIEQAEEVSRLLSDQPPLLQRCRALKHLAMETQGPGMFQWAVREKKQRDAGNQQGMIVDQQLSSWQYGCDNNLVALRSIQLTHKTPLGPVQELNDIAFAFSDSLEEMAATEKWDGNVMTVLSNAPRVVLGEGWTLPRLRVLDFEVLSSQLYFDLDALQRFSALKSLRLMDRIMEYNHREIQTWPSVSLPHLQKLDLMGSPALHFNMDSLHHSPCLEYLGLGMQSSGIYFFIPPPEEMAIEDSDTQTSPDTTMDNNGLPATQETFQDYRSIERGLRFKWNWHLPNLQKLILEAAFAFKFEFQWLQHLPKLRSVFLNTSSSERKLHERIITLEDFSRGLHHPKSEGGMDIPDRYLSLPTLESFTLYGSWIIEANVLETLCLIVAPNLREICLGPRCSGYTLREWVAVTRKMSCVELVHSERCFMDDEIRDVGLVLFDESQEGNNGKKPVEYSLSGKQLRDTLEL
ncbi:hypothetical protein BGX34_001882 [Mortierella sp. NVP85]|nr:hypothetical protein BGX34_001882 [Mortierella sp. NVP85]